MCKRVLQVVSIMNRGGIENMIMNLYRNMDRTEIQFDFVEQRNERGIFDDEIEALGGRIYRAPQYKVINHFQYKKWWENFFKEHPEYSIIHSHSYTYASVHLPIAKKYGLTTIVHAHSSSTSSGLKGVVEWLLQREIANIPDYLFACSENAGKWLFGENCKAKKNYFLLKNAIATDNYNFNNEIRHKLRDDLKLSNNFVVGHIGNFSAPKNYMYLLEIFRSVSERRQDARLLLVGNGNLREAVEDKARELGIVDKIIMTGVRSDVNDLLQAMDCFVFPSLYEGLPVTVVEAQAAGLPCFISDRITDEVCITDLVKRLPIDVKTDIWADEILKTNMRKRYNTKQQIIDAGYDVKETAKWLTDFYLNH